MPNYFRTVAKTRSEALEQVEKKLGHKDITILREGSLVNKKKKWFRVVEEKAYYIECVEYQVKTTPQASPPPPPETKSAKSKISRMGTQGLASPPQPEFSLRANLSKPDILSPTSRKSNPPNQLDDLVASITQMEKEKKGKKEDLDNLSTPEKRSQASNVLRSIDENYHSTKISKEGMDSKKVYHFLVAREFTPKFAKKVEDYFDLNTLVQSGDYHRLAKHITSFFKFSGVVKPRNEEAHYVFVVGSTGVGKTTTLSKIASSFYTNEEHYPRPSLIKFGSLDAKRIMAMEQLRKFANILRVPFHSIYGVDDFKVLYKNTRKGELILIDTSGVSKQDTDLIHEIAVFTRSLKSSKEIHLCLNAASRYYDLKSNYEVLSKTQPDRILITKIDESYSLGSVLSFVDEVKLPISYLTNGQDVPIDILSASPEQIQKILLREWGL